MPRYTIHANGLNMGTYEGTDEAAALDAYAREAGYRDYSEVVAQTGDDAATAKEHARIGSILADADGNPRCALYHDGARVYMLNPDGEFCDVPDGDCAPADVAETVLALYGERSTPPAARVWQLRLAPDFEAEHDTAYGWIED